MHAQCKKAEIRYSITTQDDGNMKSSSHQEMGSGRSQGKTKDKYKEHTH